MIHLDVQQGAGLTNIPVFAAPNGNTTGPNNDVESFGNDHVHLDQAFYEHTWFDERLAITLGQDDPTSHFDQDEAYLEAYYRFVCSGDGETQGVALSPDVQYITNAGGDGSLDPITVYGLRFQAFF